MKNIYKGENVKRTLLMVQKRMTITTNRTYKIYEIVNAFNKLPGKYQDLLLKKDINENDRANLTKVYNMLMITLVKSKNVPSDTKIVIKNINEEEEKKKNEVTLEDVEVSGDKWVKPVEKKKPILIKELEIPKVEKPITGVDVPESKEVVESNKEVKVIQNEDPKEETKTVKEEKELSKKEIEVVQNKDKKEEKKKIGYKEMVLKKYIEQRNGLNIKDILDSLNIDEEFQYVIESKFENNSVLPNDELEKIIGVKKSFIDQVVDDFYVKAIAETKKKLLALERK